MIKLYDNLDSGNAYKVRLLLNQLEMPFERIETDVFSGATRTPEFLRLNPNGRVPTVVLNDGRTLAESNAILYFFAKNTAYFPKDSWRQANTLKWMFFEQYSHEPYIAVARSIQHDPRADEARLAQIPRLVERGHEALAVMEDYLENEQWFSGDNYGIGDIALYAYTHVAPEGGVALDDYPQIRGWLERVKAAPRHRTIEAP